MDDSHLSLSTGQQRHVDEAIGNRQIKTSLRDLQYSPTVVEDALLCAALGGLFLLLCLDLGCLRLDFAGTRERSVN